MGRPCRGDVRAACLRTRRIVVNDPAGLSLAQNKLYFQDFPKAVRPATLISKSIEEIRAFIAEQRKGAIVKPLQGSGGKNVFKIDSPNDANLNQIFEAVSGEGYLIAQGYLPEAKAGDIRFFLMNGKPLMRDGIYAAFRRVPAKGEVAPTSTPPAPPRPAKITDEILAIAEMVRPKLVQDGMFLVGLDIVGDKILEINVFTPGGLRNIADMHKVDFSDEMIAHWRTRSPSRRPTRGRFRIARWPHFDRTATRAKAVSWYRAPRPRKAGDPLDPD